MLNGVHHLMLFATDVERAVRWYQDALGFEPKAVHGVSYAELTHPTVPIQIDLHLTDVPEEIGRGPILYFAVADIEAGLAALRAKGAETTEPRREQGSPRFASFKDSEGNRLGLQERP